MTESRSNDANLSRFQNQSKTGNPLQIYTVAQAVRPHKFSLSHKISGDCAKDQRKYETCQLSTIGQQPSMSDTAMELKETIQIKRKVTIKKQPRSTLPMKMIVSKKATRKREFDDPPEDCGSLDLSRYHKLTPPTWRNKSNNIKRRRPTETETIIEEMKKRCAGFNSQTKGNAIGHLDCLDLEGVLYNKGNEENILLNTPRNEHAYNQLYGCKQTRVDQRSPSFPRFDQEKQFQGNQFINHDSLEDTKKPEEKFVFNPVSTVSPKQSEFVWNPVVLKPKTIYQSNFPFETRHKTLDFYSKIQNVDGLQSFNLPSPVTPSSSSSGLTVEEESLRCTLFTKQDSSEFVERDYQSRILMPRLLNPNYSNFANTRTVTNYSKLPELNRFYEE